MEESRYGMFVVVSILCFTILADVSFSAMIGCFVGMPWGFLTSFVLFFIHSTYAGYKVKNS